MFPRWQQHWLVLACLALAAGMPESRVYAAGPVQSDAQYAAAVTAARQQGKLLLVVDLSSDFARPGVESPEWKLYRSLVLADDRVAKSLAERFSIAVRYVGPPATIQEHLARGQGTILGKLELLPGHQQPRSNPSQCITYFCLPDERVLHFVPGFLSAQDFLRELDWVEASYAEVVRADLDREQLRLRELHQSSIAGQDRQAFEARVPVQWKDNQPPEEFATKSLAGCVVLARQICEQSLLKRLTQRETATTGAELLSSLLSHSQASGEYSHLLLAEFPLVHLRDLERPAFESWAGCRFWTRSKQQGEVEEWWLEARRRRKPVVLVIPDDPRTLDANDTPFTWPLPPDDQPDDLEQFASRLLTLDELGQLMTDNDLAPISFLRDEGPPRYIIYSAAGFRCAQMPQSQSSRAHLAHELRNVLTQTKEVAGATK